MAVISSAIVPKPWTAVFAQRALSARDHSSGLVVRARQEEEVQGVVVEVLEGREQVAGDDAQRRRRDTERHLERQRGGDGVHAAAHSARAAGDVDRVPRVATLEDDLIAAEERRHRVRLEHLAILEIDHRVEREGTCDACHRVEVDATDVPVSRHQLLELVLPGRVLQGHELPRLVGPRVRRAVDQAGVALFVELDRQVLEAHG